MEYKLFQGKSLSRLGLGNMRLPTTEPGGPIDKVKAQEIVDRAIAQGINYFDTAWFYHNGESERFLGEALAKYPRESYYLADKMPSSVLQSGELTPQQLFETQLKKCNTEYFDFYLLHNVSEASVDLFTDEKLGVIPYLLEEKKAGRIRHLGFSSHSTPATLKKFLDRYDFFEFVQIQLNYLDWTLQDARSQYEIITEYGVPVWVMEPCRGGRLASLNPEVDGLLKGKRPDKSVASWAFRWLQGLDNVQVVLSGMTQLDQVEDNLDTFSTLQPLSDEEQKVLDEALDVFRKSVFIPCTKCHYCDGCPKGLDIPKLLHMYNAYRLNPSPFAKMNYNKLDEGERADRCIHCGRCISKCPQHIDIPAELRAYAGAMAE